MAHFGDDVRRQRLRGGALMGDYLILLFAAAGVVIVVYAFWAPDLKGWYDRMRDNKR